MAMNYHSYIALATNGTHLGRLVALSKSSSGSPQQLDSVEGPVVPLHHRAHLGLRDAFDFVAPRSLSARLYTSVRILFFFNVSLYPPLPLINSIELSAGLEFETASGLSQSDDRPAW